MEALLFCETLYSLLSFCSWMILFFILHRHSHQARKSSHAFRFFSSLLEEVGGVNFYDICFLYRETLLFINKKGLFIQFALIMETHRNTSRINCERIFEKKDLPA